MACLPGAYDPTRSVVGSQDDRIGNKVVDRLLADCPLQRPLHVTAGSTVAFDAKGTAKRTAIARLFVAAKVDSDWIEWVEQIALLTKRESPIFVL